MIEINLLPNVKRELLKTRAMRNRVISISFLVGGASIAAVVVLALILGSQIAAEAVQNGVIKDRNDKLMAVEDLNKVVTIQHQLTKINEQHSGKKLNSRIFDVVTAVNPVAPNNVSFSDIKVNPESKTITLEGSAVNGYSALETLKKTILNTKIQTTDGDKSSEVSLTKEIKDGDTSFGENSEGKKVLQFSFSFEYAEELLAPANNGTVSVLTPTGKVDVTDSRQGIPDSLFKSNSKKQEKK
ncbi:MULTISPECIES: PilN domain-containing protein [unclassified Candidatus Nanosynbacter]|jgi:hypothetical protein cdiviTM7_02674|uniref:PilN domain-containing protein n=1 Tax=unclassified Candidatus Nanosynbacter TaxID=2725944 RepID=UPI00101BA41F|nr:MULTISPECIES: hypothetical protein [unclassified Candidatus Nanosynbacter]MCJ1963018.1 hypothetical protein [Candidatus Nanosynbacter sp. TM7-033]MCJ1967180.1 hypothetical protein [Candidatus Nanosynbacter sp. TM7-075]UOG68216.1 hypothetical protein LRM46_01710 [Candidatus Nanosynbacter sp. HMT-352]